MTAPSIVLVEDDAPLRTLTSRALREHGYHVRAAATGAEMWVLLENEPADLVVLDIMLPGTSGIDLLRRLRKTSEVPVIFVSARGSEEDRVLGLELGADDYLAKPFGTRELIARIGAVLRRHGAPTDDARSHGPARSASWAGHSRSPGANCARPRARSSISPARTAARDRAGTPDRTFAHAPCRQLRPQRGRAGQPPSPQAVRRRRAGADRDRARNRLYAERRGGARLNEVWRRHGVARPAACDSAAGGDDRFRGQFDRARSRQRFRAARGRCRAHGRASDHRLSRDRTDPARQSQRGGARIEHRTVQHPLVRAARRPAHHGQPDAPARAGAGVRTGPGQGRSADAPAALAGARGHRRFDDAVRPLLPDLPHVQPVGVDAQPGARGADGAAHGLAGVAGLVPVSHHAAAACHAGAGNAPRGFGAAAVFARNRPGRSARTDPRFQRHAIAHPRASGARIADAAGDRP
ncbi:hypothetical protein Lal_00007226 [Lupinus albus]|nr:hypothetical protein Lal_00007226 [Lupinus albus]